MSHSDYFQGRTDFEISTVDHVRRWKDRDYDDGVNAAERERREQRDRQRDEQREQQREQQRRAEEAEE